MNIPAKIGVTISLLFSVAALACSDRKTETPTSEVSGPTPAITATATPEPAPSASPRIPNLQSEILSKDSTVSSSPIGKFDFKNFSYPLPRGWQDSDGKEADLVNGKRPFTMTPEVERIGLSFVTVKYFDATGDGEHEAIVVLKIETGGSAIPQLVYIFKWKDDAPELVWNFRTGDRADGGLKNIRLEDGKVVVDLFGQDRYIVGELDTAKITGDEEQICCPTHWTRSRYKWNGTAFRLEGKRLTFSTANSDAPPVENMVEAVQKQNSGKK
ncbi:MAG: hypothetical protein IPN69_07295 [Acidobacteria bacterium]|nr:hypothetical protein [Acidobacteriota bacterium]MBK8810525.1 hypothetical protein [Acidobacteriota bacterium]